MKYFIDFEFIEGKIPQKIFGLNIPKWLSEPNNTIQAISVGIVAEDGREYYAISKDFNLKEAWNRYQLEDDNSVGVRIGCLPNKKKAYWLRENVLKPIFLELCNWDEGIFHESGNLFFGSSKGIPIKGGFTYSNLKKLINLYGKSNKQIAKEIYDFINPDLGFHVASYNNSELRGNHPMAKHFDAHNVDSDDYIYFARPEFYAYYADYDWVVFCQLFGTMMDLPTGFPMYCNDLKQTLDEKAILFDWSKSNIDSSKWDIQYKIEVIKRHCAYPQQTNEHNALADARWNFELYKFLNTLQ